MAGSRYEEYRDQLKSKYGISGGSSGSDISGSSTDNDISVSPVEEETPYESYRRYLQEKNQRNQQLQTLMQTLMQYDQDVVQKYYTDYDAFLDTASGIDTLTWEQGMQGSGYLQPQLDTLATTDKEIRQWLIDNKDALGDEYYNQTMRNLNAIGAQNADLTRAYDENVEFWSQFDSQEGYDNYLAGQERAAQLEGVDIEALTAEIEAQKQALLEWGYANEGMAYGTPEQIAEFDAYSQEQNRQIEEKEQLLRDAKDYQGYYQGIIDRDMQPFSGMTPQEQEALRRWVSYQPGGQNFFAMTQSGVGMSPEQWAQINDPYNAMVGKYGQEAVTNMAESMSRYDNAAASREIEQRYDGTANSYSALEERYGPQALAQMVSQAVKTLGLPEESAAVYGNYNALVQKYGQDAVAQIVTELGGGTQPGVGLGDFAKARALGVLSLFTAPMGRMHSQILSTGRFDGADPNSWGNWHIQEQQAIDRALGEKAGEEFLNAAEMISRAAENTMYGTQIHGATDPYTWYNQLSDKGKETVDVIGNLGYQIGANYVDNGIRQLTAMAIGGGNTMATEIINSGLASMGAFNATYMQYSQNGYSVGQSLLQATIAAATEALTERIGMDALLDTIGKGNVSVLKGLLKSGFAELGEETIGFLVTNLADTLILGEDSGFMRGMQAYKDAGMSDREALQLQLRDKGKELAETAIVSFGSGGLAGASATFTSQEYSDQVRRDRAVRQVQQRLVDLGVTRSEARQVSEKLYEASLEYGSHAEAMRQNYVPGQDVGKYTQEFEKAYQVGKADGNQGALTDPKHFPTLLPSQAKVAYQLGRQAGNPRTARTQTEKPDALEEEFSLSDDGKTYRTDKPEWQEIQVKRFTRAGRGGIALDVGSGESVDIQNVSFGDPDEAVLYVYIGKVATDAEQANLILEKFRGQTAVNGADFAAGLMQAYEAGRIGYATKAELKDMELAGLLPVGVRTVVFSNGQTVGDHEARSKDDRRRYAARQTKGPRKAGTVHFDRGGRSFNQIQETALWVMEQLAKALGIEFYVFESYEKDGKRVYTDSEGKEVSAPNGFYDPSDGSIHIDLNAGNDGKGTMLFTVAHELTHFIQEWSPVKFRSLARLLVDAYGKEGQSIQELIDGQKAKATANGRSLTTEEAFAEVVADSMEAMMVRGDLGWFMNQVQKKDQRLWQKMASWFKDLARKLETAINAYADYTPDSPEGRMVVQMEGALAELQKAFAEGLSDASRNYQAAEGQKNTTREGGSVLEQARSNKKIPSNQQSANVRRSVKQRGAGSTHVNMSSTAAANLLGIDNISNASDKVKYAISVLGEFYNSVAARQPVMGFGKTISGSNLEGSLVAANVLIRQGTSGSAYRKDGEHELRVSNHSAHSENFKGNGEHLSIALKGKKAINKFLTSENNVIEAIFSKSDLDRNPKKLKALIVDIARFIATGEYHDTAGAEKYNYSGTEEFVKAAQARMQADKERRDNIIRSDRDPTAKATQAELEKQNEKLREDVVRLRELVKLQGKETGGTVFKPDSIFAAGQYLAQYANAKLDSKERKNLNTMLKDFYTFLATESDYSWEDVQEKAKPIAQYLQQRVNLKPQLSDYARDVLREIRSQKIALTDSQKAAVESRYGSYTDFRKATSGSVTFSEAGENMATVWQGLAGLFPGTFDENISEADMPGALMDIIDSMRNSDTSQLEYAYNREIILADLTRAVYDSYWRVSNLRTVADRYASKIRDLRSKHREQMEALRSSKNDTIASLKAQRREELDRIRQEHRQEVKNKVKATEQRYQESRARAVEGRNKTAMRNRIQKAVNELNRLLLNGDKEHHVPEGLRKAVAEILDSINMEVTSQEDRQRNYERTLIRYEQKIRYETDPEKKAMLEAARDAYRDKGDQFKAKMDALKAAYDEIKNETDPILVNAYSDGLSAYLQTLIVEVGDTPLRDMSLQQLETVYEVCRIVTESIRNANRSFTNSRNGTIREQGKRTAGEVRAAGGIHDDRVGMLDPVRKFLWNNFKPVYAMARIGSRTFMEAFEQVRNGEDVWAMDIVEARQFFLETAEKHGYNGWDMKETKTFHTPSGIEFRLNLEQMMSIYAYSKRKDAQDHLRLGGIVFDSNDEVYSTGKRGLLARKINTANAYQIGANTLQELMEALTAEQIAFVDDMQRYLSDTMGAKGNEVSMAMYGVKLFRDKNYFPLKSARQYLQELEQPAGEVKLKNSGFTKKTKPGANNPMVLGNFMDVWSKHVNDMSLYHGFTLPLEDFNRIFNYQTPKSEEAAPVSVKAAIQGAYSPAAVQYISQMLTDVNGGARNDPAAGVINRGLSLFKKGAVFASASVVIQQPSAIARAAALIDVKYFAGKRIDPQKHAELWAEAKQYAPVAVIKEMGFFDTSVGKSTQDYITGRAYHGLREQAKALVTDSNFRDEVLSKAPAFADEVAWAGIWNAVKREQADLHKDMDTRSKEFLTMCGKRFTDVIVRTQVYDSVLSRSGNMRSKDTGMKMATAFMAEPTTSINMLADALIQGKRGKKTYARRTVGAVIAAQVLNAILVSLVYAGRDDDEDKTYLEKYLKSLSNNIWNDVFLLVPSSIPFIRDVVSLAQGYEVERSDMSVVSDIMDAFKKLGRDNLTPWQKVEAVTGSVCQLFGLPVKNILRDVRAVFNTWNTVTSGERTTARGALYAAREGVTGKGTSNAQQLYNARVKGDEAHIQRIAARYETEESADAAVRTVIKDRFLSGEIDEWNASRELLLYGGLDASEAHWTVDEWVYTRDTGSGDGYSRYGKIFDAALAGEDIETYIQEFTENGYDRDDVTANLKKQIGKWYYLDSSETRITRADAQKMLEQYLDMNAGEIEEQLLKWDMRMNTGFSYESMKEKFLAQEITEDQAMEYLQTYGGMDKYDARERVNDWLFEEEWGFSYSDIRQTYLDREITAEEARQVMMEDAGKTQEEADRSIELWDFEAENGWAYEDRVKLFKRDHITEEQLRNALMEIGDYSREDADTQIEVYRWEMDGYQYVTMSRVEKWHKYAEPAGISKEMFLEIMRFSSATENDLDENGKPISYSAMKKVMAEIDRLPLSREQKNALAKAMGWSDKNINRYKPW